MKNQASLFLSFLISVISVFDSFAQVIIDTDKLQKQIQAAVAAVELQKNLPSGLLGSKRNFTLEEIWKESKFRAESLSELNSMKDGTHYTSLETISGGSAIVEYSYKTGEVTDTIVKSEKLVPEGKQSPIEIESYQFSSDETKVLVSAESEHIYRHSTKELYYVFDLKSKKLSKISDEKIRLAEFSPSGNLIAFVQDNNLFVKDIVTGADIQVSKDGKWNEIINGATDWVYEEEFSFDKAYFWSPDGKKIAFYRFDESKVKEFSMNMYGTLYPSENRFKYPKAGEENAKVSIHIFDIDSRKTVKVKISPTQPSPKEGITNTQYQQKGSVDDKVLPLGEDLGGAEYIPRIKWTKDPNLLSIQKMNRHQSTLDLLIADATTGDTRPILSEKNDTYIDITNDLTFLDVKKQFIWTSEKNGFNHIYLYEMSGKMIRQITSGNWDVTEFKGVDEKTSTLFYISAEDSPIVRKLYSIKLDGTGKKKLSEKNGFSDAHFSEKFQFYINNFSDSYTPSKITLIEANGKEIRVLKDNQSLKDTLALYNVSMKEFFKFKTSENVQLNGWVIKPANFDSTKKYPVFMFVYGGPGAQTVENQWGGVNDLWYQYLSQKGYIVASVDNRGTGARGSAFKKCTYKELGKLETIDQIEAAKYLRTIPWVDKSRIGIQGWSYGGYMSSLCITKGADIFKMAIAVAPVTNWRYYDSIYTERYMQTPQENPDGYDDNSPINHVDKLKGKFLLIHGTADDNVHFQNSVEMVSALVKANKQFEQFFYPDKNHGIYGGNTRFHLYTKMTNFILENL